MSIVDISKTWGEGYLRGSEAIQPIGSTDTEALGNRENKAKS